MSTETQNNALESAEPLVARDLLRRAKMVLQLVDKDKGSTICTGGLISDISTYLAAPVAAQAQPPKLTPDELESLHDFRRTTIDDSYHTLDKPMIKRLTSVGALESIGFGKHRLTEYGEWLLEPNASAQQPVSGDDLSKALRHLIRGYVNLIENGRDRILEAGGRCDPLDVMEASDPWLKSARAALAQQGSKT